MFLFLFSIIFSANLTISVKASDEDCNLQTVKVSLYNDSNGEKGDLISSADYAVPADKKCVYIFTHNFTNIDESLNYWVEGNATDSAGLSRTVLLSRIALSGNYATLFNLMCPSEDLFVKVTRKGEPLSNVDVNVSILTSNAPETCSFINNNFNTCYKNKISYKDLCISKGFNFSDSEQTCYESIVYALANNNACSVFSNLNNNIANQQCTTLDNKAGCGSPQVYLRKSGVGYLPGYTYAIQGSTQGAIQTTSSIGTYGEINNNFLDTKNGNLSVILKVSGQTSNVENRLVIMTSPNDILTPQRIANGQMAENVWYNFTPQSTEVLALAVYNDSNINPNMQSQIIFAVYPEGAGNISVYGKKLLYNPFGGSDLVSLSTTSSTNIFSFFKSNLLVRYKSILFNASPYPGFRFKYFVSPLGTTTTSNPFELNIQDGIIKQNGFIIAVFEPEGATATSSFSPFCSSYEDICQTFNNQKIGGYNWTYETLPQSCTGTKNKKNLSELCNEINGVVFGSYCYNDSMSVEYTKTLLGSNRTDVNGTALIKRNLSDFVSNKNWTAFVSNFPSVYFEGNFSHQTYGKKEDKVKAMTCPVNGQCQAGFSMQGDVCVNTGCQEGQVLENGQCIEDPTKGINVNYNVYCMPGQDNLRIVEVRVSKGGVAINFDCNLANASDTISCQNGRRAIVNVGTYTLNVNVQEENYRYKKEINTQQCTEIRATGAQPTITIYPENNAFISGSIIKANSTATDSVDKDVSLIQLNFPSGSLSNTSASESGQES
ncbi:MAG: hypothetical protein QXI89_01595, partial [Candidatus Anstonellales archaeon]